MGSSCGARLLIVEDEPLLRITISDALEKEGWAVDQAGDGARGLVLFKRILHDVVLVDLVMPEMGGMEVLRRIKEIAPDTTVIVITAYGTVDKAVDAMREGAADFITKPFSIPQLLVRLESICSTRQLKQRNIQLQQQLEQRYSFANIIGKSKEMQRIFEIIQVVAASEANVLIQGESGTGKELVAAAIHYNSPRRAGPYIRVSCASLPESLIESELFGYEKGAFTGATQRRIGRFEAANGGTLFLDEIGDLPPAIQIKLLRALQERQIERLGSQRTIDVDVRFVAATLASLEDEVAAGRFRNDLFFRINTVTISLPPLRERREDIPLLAMSFLRELTAERERPIEGFSEEVLQLFDSYPWPGNVRELRNVVERAVLFCRRAAVELEDLPPNLLQHATLHRAPAGRGPVIPLQEAIKNAEKEAIRNALARTGGRRAEAAELLRISRKTLWEKIKSYKLDGVGR